MEDFIHVDTLDRIAGGLCTSADGVIEALLNAAPGKPNTPLFLSVASSFPPPYQAGGDNKDTAAKTPDLAERVAAARRNNASNPAPMTPGGKPLSTINPLPSILGEKSAKTTSPKTPDLVERVAATGRNNASKPAPRTTGERPPSVSNQPTRTKLAEKAKPETSVPTNSRAKYGLKSMGDIFVPPAKCGPWAVQLRRGVDAHEHVSPYRDTLGEILGVWINVGFKNKVFMKPRRFEDKTLSDEVIDLQADYNLRMAYSMPIN